MGYNSERQHRHGHMQASSLGMSNPITHPPLFRNISDPVDAAKVGYEWIETDPYGKDHPDRVSERTSGSRRSSRTVTSRHSFDSDLRNHFRQSRLQSMQYDSGKSASSVHVGAPLVDFALSRYPGALVSVSPPKERLKSFTKLFSGSWHKKRMIGQAMDPKHMQHVEYDPRSGHFVGLPKEWEQFFSSGSSGHQVKAFTSAHNQPAPPNYTDAVPTSGPKDDHRRSTRSPTNNSHYSYNSRYNIPAERPPSFPSTTPSISDDVSVDIDALRGVPTTPRPLPHIPLDGPSLAT